MIYYVRFNENGEQNGICEESSLWGFPEFTWYPAPDGFMPERFDTCTFENGNAVLNAKSDVEIVDIEVMQEIYKYREAKKRACMSFYKATIPLSVRFKYYEAINQTLWITEEGDFNSTGLAIWQGTSIDKYPFKMVSDSGAIREYVFKIKGVWNLLTNPFSSFLQMVCLTVAESLRQANLACDYHIKKINSLISIDTIKSYDYTQEIAGYKIEQGELIFEFTSNRLVSYKDILL